MQKKRVERVYRLSRWMITLGEYINAKHVFNNCIMYLFLKSELHGSLKEGACTLFFLS
jgi:hypothetical protein